MSDIEESTVAVVEGVGSRWRITTEDSETFNVWTGGTNGPSTLVLTTDNWMKAMFTVADGVRAELAEERA